MNVNVNNYGICAGDLPDTVWKLRELLNKYRQQEEICLYFSSGTYHFYPDYAEEVLLFIPNHDEDTIKRVAFNLTGYKHLKIMGEQAEFVFHTDIIPFLIRECKDIHIEGISIDYAKPGFSQGIIRKAEPRKKVIEINQDEFPWHVKGDRVYFCGENYSRELERWIELDAATAAPAYGLADNAYNVVEDGAEAHYKKIGENLLEITLGEGEESFSAASKEGNYLILRHHLRNCPAFLVEESSDICLKKVELYHALAMGVAALRTKNMILEEVNVRCHPQKNHVYTMEADSFHFVLCSGIIKIHKCLSENQFDDPINIHGIYGRIKMVLEDGSFVAELVHHQQKGAAVVKSGEEFRIVDNNTMLPFADGIAKKVESWNKDYFRVWPETEIPDLKPGYVLENTEWMPEVEISECVFKNNRARGILCTTGKRTVICKNYFHVPGAAVLIAGDANFWFESGAAGEVIVEDNIFDQCAYVPEWGKAPIQVEPNTENFQENMAYHGRLIVRNNCFYVSDERLFNGMNLRELVWENNTVKKEAVFPGHDGEAFVLKHVLNMRENWRGLSGEAYDGDSAGVPEYPYRKDYTKTLTMKLFLAAPDGQGGSKVRLKFDEALELIKKIDNVTRGIPKILYLTGWQYNGHDDKYPSWDKVNEALKCTSCRHSSAKECLLWLMEEAYRYNTTVSFHVNSTDAYADSPLWKEYAENDLISRKDGEYLVTGNYNGKNCCQINYKNEWESGYYKKRVDRLVAEFPVRKAGTIHSDAFFCRSSDQSTMEEEQAARRKMIRYWRECGVDLTSEFLYGEGESEECYHGGAGTGLIGLIPMIWHFNQSDGDYMKRPAFLVTGGGINPDIPYGEDGKNVEFLFGRSMWGEPIFTQEGCYGPVRDWEQKFINEFCTTTLVWAYLNQFKRLRLTGQGESRKVTYSDHLITSLKDRTMTKDGKLLRIGDDVFIPAVWKEKEIIAYSKEGYRNRCWELPKAWNDVKCVDLFSVSRNGLMKIEESVECADGALNLSLKAGQMISIMPRHRKGK